MSAAADGRGGGPTELDWDEMGVSREEFYDVIDASPSMNRLGERIERVQSRFQQLRESGEPGVDELEEIRAEVEDIGEQLEALGVM